MSCCRPPSVRSPRRLLLAFVAVALLVAAVLAGRWLRADSDGAVTLADSKAWEGELPPGATQRFSLAGAETERLYSVLVVLDAPAQLGDKDGVVVTVRDGQRVLSETLLHSFDDDSFVVVRPTAAGPLTVECRSHAAKPLPAHVTVRRWTATAAQAAGRVEYEPNDTWQQANPIQLNTVVFGHCDDRQMYPALHDPRTGPLPKLLDYGQPMSGNEARALGKGEDWYRFTVAGQKPLLVYFELDVLDREVPLDVSVWQVKDGKPVAVVSGIDPTSDIVLETPAIDPHEVQTRLGNKFTTRVLAPGNYLLRVEGNHPAYQLRTFTYEAAEFDPKTELRAQASRAVRTGMDYLVNAGDSWHANIPRMGGVQNRLYGVHAETAQCIACHPTHFSTRGHQTAVANGYPVKQRPALKFLAERLYNNPRPFYGHEQEATWARMISASANVMSRLGYLVNLYERDITHEPRTKCLEGVTGYLKLYYGERTKLPGNESNGNTPVVSTYEVAGHSWLMFDEMARRTNKKEYAEYRDRLTGLIEQDTFSKRKDSAKQPVLLGLCYQTADFVQIDPKKYAGRIQQNCEQILKLQRPDGQWSMLTDPKSESVKFQTGHCLWVLGLAGYTPEHPQVRKGVEALLRTRQQWGGWLDSSTYENFKTPFRETQFAVMALSQLYPNEDAKRGPEQARGWQTGFAPLPKLLNLDNEVELLTQLDQIWERPNDAVVMQMSQALKHPEVLVRQTAAEAAGRTLAPELLGGVAKLLGDPSKVVRHSAAWAMREYATRGGLGLVEIKTALVGEKEATRRGAMRVFAQHFSYLTHDHDLAQAVQARLGDPDPLVRMLATRAVWQWFWWTKNLDERAEIVDALINRLEKEQQPSVRRNLREAIYNVADENTRYLYNNWIPLLARQADKDKASQAQKAQMKMIGDRVARALASDNEGLVENVLQALGEFHLRRGGAKNKTRYGRIGNDIEQIQFYADSRDTLEPLLVKLLGHKSPSVREHAAVAAFTLKGVAKELPLHWLDLYADDSPRVRAVAAELQASFPLTLTPQTEGQLGARLVKLLASPHAEARNAALATVGKLGGKVTANEKVLAAVREFLTSGDPQRVPAALAALPQFPALHKDAKVREALVEALASEDVGVRRAALETALTVPAVADTKQAQFLTNRLLRSEKAENRQLVFEVVRTRPALADNLEIVSVVSEALAAKDDTVRREALALVQKFPGMGKNPAVRLALKSLLDDPSERTRQLAEQLYEGKGGTLPKGDVSQLLDFDYFVERVQPLFAVKGGDGQACALCHHTHTIFRLSRPAADGGFTAKQSREHYRAALKVIDLGRPEQSLILRKPLVDAAQEGVIDQKTLSHGGGVRWNGTEDPAYRTLLAWINGARLKK